MEPEDYYLGRTAYEAYCATTGWKTALPEFHMTPEAVQRGWIAAAAAVVRAYEA